MPIIILNIRIFLYICGVNKSKESNIKQCFTNSHLSFFDLVEWILFTPNYFSLGFLHIWEMENEIPSEYSSVSREMSFLSVLQS